MDDVARLPASDRAALFNETGARQGLATGIIDHAALSLVFKGGTSISKTYGVIRRFSEDIDLSFDRRQFGYVDARDPEAAPSNKKARELVEQLADAVRAHIAEVFLPRLTEIVRAELGAPGGWELFLDPDDPDRQTVTFRYPPSLRGDDYANLAYIPPFVRLELGARGDPWPVEGRRVTPYAAEHFPEFFREHYCDVTVLAIERTFWEKATILHAEHHRPLDKALSLRVSRHYYDLALLSETEYAERALKQLDMLERVVEHKKVYFASAWARYDLAKPGSLRLVPAPQRMGDLAADYAKMAPMIFDVPPPPFNYLMERIIELERLANSMNRM